MVILVGSVDWFPPLKLWTIWTLRMPRPSLVLSSELFFHQFDSFVNLHLVHFWAAVFHTCAFFHSPVEFLISPFPQRLVHTAHCLSAYHINKQWANELLSQCLWMNTVHFFKYPYKSCNNPPPHVIQLPEATHHELKQNWFLLLYRCKSDLQGRRQWNSATTTTVQPQSCLAAFKLDSGKARKSEAWLMTDCSC